MSSKPMTVIIEPESELGRALEKAEGSLILLKDGARYRVSREVDDPWASYDREKVRAGLRKFAGMLSTVEAEQMKDAIYRGREEGSRPPDRP